MNNLLFKNASEKLKKLTDLLQNSIKGTHFEGKVYYVGGCVRDLLLNREVKDIDIVVAMRNGGILFATYMAMKNLCFIKGCNPVVFETYGTAKFQLYKDEDLKDIEIECVQTRKEQYHSESRNPDTVFGTIQEDAKRRDLTINALYYNISDEKIYDFNGVGFYDIYNQVIRTPSEADLIFSDDPLRILRVIRFSSKLGWGIDKDTWLGIIKNVDRLSIVSKERINDELSKILLCKKPSVGIRKMYYSGVLSKVLPDIYDTTEVYESKNPMVTTFDHTMDVLDETQPYIESRLAALFHDVGKIMGDKVKPDNLDEFSADVTAADLKMMKFPNYIIKSVETAIKYHRVFKQYQDGTLPSDKKIRKFINICGKDLGTVVDLMNANNYHTTYGKKTHQVLDILNRIEELEDIDKMTNVKLPINGKDIMKEFNIKGGPTIGTLLNAVKDSYFENPSITKEECLKIAEEKLKSLEK